MTDAATPAAIARRLTARQREALLWLPADGASIGCLTFPPGADPAMLQWIVVTDWMRVNLADNRDEILRYRLTPLGRGVREAVEAGNAT